MNAPGIFHDWFVLQVKNGQEFLVDRVLKTEGSVKSLVFVREMLHTKRMLKKLVSMPLFPGYVFVQKKLDSALEYLKTRMPSQFIRPIMFNDKAAKVHEYEMKDLFCYADHKGRIKLSSIEIKGDSIIIKEGPLKNIKGQLLFVNRKKGKAKVRVNLFNRELEVSLGVEVVGNRSVEKNCYKSVISS